MNTRFTAQVPPPLLALLTVCCMFVVPPTQAALSLQHAVNIALKNDPWVRGNQLKQGALQASSIAASTLPDPVLSFGLLNLPTDGFALDQEPMTQIKLGLQQTFPRGDSQAIRHKQLNQLADQHPLLAEDRRAKVALNVSQLWLQVYTAEQSIRLIEHDRALFEQLADIVQASYSSAQGKTRQQDVVRAQLELSRLDDRLNRLHEKGEMALAKLMEWLVGDPQRPPTNRPNHRVVLPLVLPSIDPLKSEYQGLLASQNRSALAETLALHPALLALDQRIKASFTGVRLQEQKYQAQWGVNGSYAYRDDQPNGSSRADFFSLGLSVDLPLFTRDRQDQTVAASRMQAESMKTEKILLLRAMMAQLDSLYARYLSLNKRSNLFKQNILPQMHEQAEAALTAYTNDDGDFAEVMRARIAELNGRIEALSINTQTLATQFHINYFFKASSSSMTFAERLKP